MPHFRPSGPLLLTIAVAAACVVAARAQVVTAEMLGPILLATGTYAASIALKRVVWAGLLALGGDDLERSAGPRFLVGGFLVSTMSLAGVMTPMSLGVDVLQSIYGRRYLRVGMERTAVASLLARELKLHASIVLFAPLVAFAPATFSGYWPQVAVAALVTAALALAFRWTRSRAAQRAAAGRSVESVIAGARTARLRLGCRRLALVHTALLLAFGFEWWTLHSCLAALGAGLPWSSTMLLYAVLYLLARIPLFPQGVAVVECSGYALLRMMGVPPPESAALLVIWATLRIVLPVLLAVIAGVILTMWQPANGEA